jgi:hypothetical protein
MNIWITTIGNSDIQIKDKKNWMNLGRKAQNRLRSSGYTNYSQPELNQIEKESDNTKKEYVFVSPSRILGIIYSQDVLDEESSITHRSYYNDLLFPLLDNFTNKLKDIEVKLDKIIYLLTDQQNIFPENKRSKKCPYWQDTITIQPILEEYFKQNFSESEQEYLALKPSRENNDEDSIGLDDWNDVLTLVQEQIAKISVNENDTVYVSHQAGTPAISSAVQFTTLACFGKQVKFLVSNEFNNQLTSIIEGSNYLKGIQIQQAKQLIKSGTPGAAQELLDVNRIKIDQETNSELEELVNIFNIKNPGSTENDSNDFTVAVAIKRVIRALDLVEKYFEQKNYIQGITLLAAAHEAFMKAGIFHKLSESNINIWDHKVFNFLIWNNKGFVFADDQELDNSIYQNIQQQFHDFFANEYSRKSKMYAELSPCLKKEYEQNFIDKLGGKLQFNDIQYQRNKENILKEKLKIEILEKLQFPLDTNQWQLKLWEQWYKRWFGSSKEREKNYVRLSSIGSNLAMYQWLLNLTEQEPITPWGLLRFIGEFKREREDDKRSQIMHNLRGVEEKDVIKYLKGLDNSESQESDNSETNDVIKVYRTKVKEPFIQAIEYLGLYEEEKPNLEERLNNLARKLSQ